MRDEDYARFIKSEVSSETHRHGGSVEVTRAPAVWTLAHRGYSGSGRLDVWVYPTQQDALYEGARLAMAAGLDEEVPKAGEFPTPDACRPEAKLAWESAAGMLAVAGDVRLGGQRL